MNWKYLLNIVAFRHWTDLFIQDWSQKCVKFHTRLFWQLLITTLSIITSISELKLFVEYHSIQMLNKSFHLGLIYVKFDINLFWPTSYRNTFTYNDYQSTGNLLRISYHSDIEQNFSSRAGHRIVWNPIHIYSDNFQSKHFYYLSVGELKIFVVYHSIQMLNRYFHPGLFSEFCKISCKFILTTSYQTNFNTNEYQWTENICWMSYLSDI